MKIQLTVLIVVSGAKPQAITKSTVDKAYVMYVAVSHPSVLGCPPNNSASMDCEMGWCPPPPPMKRRGVDGLAMLRVRLRWQVRAMFARDMAVVFGVVKG